MEPFKLDLRNYFGRQDELQEALKQSDAVYVRGGNVFILRRALAQSSAEELLKEMLREDSIVYGGYSAGPVMLGPTLRGIEGHEDDPHKIPVGYRSAVIWDGLGILPYVPLPHYEPYRPDIREKMAFYIESHVPFVALRDGEALVGDGQESGVVS